LETDVRFGKFIRRSAGNVDWIAGTETTGIYNNRWNIGSEETPIKAPADPCPAGWRVPTRTEWASIYGQAGNCTSGNCFGNAKVNKWHQDFEFPSGNSVTHGVSLTPSSEKGGAVYDVPVTLFLPAGSGRNRSGATIEVCGTYSIYWSSSVAASSVSAYGLRCYSPRVYPSATYDRSFGSSVRCVSE
jgi:uncharacterized protein (TIGR02145 family)